MVRADKAKREDFRDMMVLARGKKEIQETKDNERTQVCKQTAYLQKSIHD